MNLPYLPDVHGSEIAPTGERAPQPDDEPDVIRCACGDPMERGAQQCWRCRGEEPF